MMKWICVGVAAACLLVPGAAFAKKFRENDNSTHNSCAYVHKWFTMSHRPHVVFVTVDGQSYGQALKSGSSCSAGGASTLSEAITYAVGRCNANNKRSGDHRPCKVAESR